MHGRIYVYFVCIVWALILGFAGPPLLLGESPSGGNGPAGPGMAVGLPLVREMFSVYLWGAHILPADRSEPLTKLLMNVATCFIWGILAGRLITWTAARRNRRYKGNHERE